MPDELRERAAARLLLVEGNSTFRAGLRWALEATDGVAVVGEAESALEALEIEVSVRPDVAVVDVSLPDSSGIELCRRLVDLRPAIRVVVLSGFDWDVFLAGAWGAGAVAFVLTTMPTEELVQTIRQAATGQLYTPEQLERIQVWERTVGERLQALSAREWVVLRLVASGQSNREIAEKLTLSENTVEKHLSALLQKLETPSRTALLALVLRYHLDHSDGLGPLAGIRRPRVAPVRRPRGAEVHPSDTVAEIRHPEIAEIRHTEVAENRYPEVADFRHLKMAEIRDDRTSLPRVF